jgi:hypothetical protein
MKAAPCSAVLFFARYPFHASARLANRLVSVFQQFAWLSLCLPGAFFLSDVPYGTLLAVLLCCIAGDEACVESSAAREAWPARTVVTERRPGRAGASPAKPNIWPPLPIETATKAEVVYTAAMLLGQPNAIVWSNLTSSMLLVGSVASPPTALCHATAQADKDETDRHMEVGAERDEQVSERPLLTNEMIWSPISQHDFVVACPISLAADFCGDVLS